MKNNYELLEVSEKASPEVIKKAYITLVKKYHPDLQPDDEKKSAEDKIKEINEAYEVLSDKAKKESYDRKLQMQRVKKNIIILLQIVKIPQIIHIKIQIELQTQIIKKIIIQNLIHKKELFINLL